jgi:hypothetical protein
MPGLFMVVKGLTRIGGLSSGGRLEYLALMSCSTVDSNTSSFAREREEFQIEHCFEFHSRHQ